jgi:hypothetical protein
MRRPWGEFFVQRLYNAQEEQYPLIDNLAGSNAGLKYRMRDRGTIGSLADVARFTRFVLLETSPAQQREALGEERGAGEPVAWEIPKARKLGYRLVTDGLAEDDPLRVLVSEQNAAGADVRSELTRSLRDPDEISDEEIAMLCDALEVRRAEGQPGQLLSCGEVKLGYALKASGLIPRERTLRRRLQSLTAYPSMLYYVYGHTHAVEKPWSIDLGGRRTVTIANTGAFHRLIDDRAFRAEADRAGMKPEEALKGLPFDVLPPCHSTVTVVYADGRPQIETKNWLDDEQGGRFVDVCDAACAKLGRCAQR